VSADERVRLAREYLTAARQRDINFMPPSRMAAELAETRRQLGLVLAAVAEMEQAAAAPATRLDSEPWTCVGCGGQMIGRRPADDRCRDCAPGGAE
jgi:hypothetical protein